MGRISNAERTRLFGPPSDRGPLVVVETPWGIRVPVHRAIVGVFQEACRRADARSAWKPKRIDSFNPRPIRGSSSWSIHSWALAFDFFATGPGVPPPGGVWTPHNGVPADFASAFTELGFTWGANFSRKDVPHIEWAGPPPTGTPTQEDLTIMDEQTKGYFESKFFGIAGLFGKVFERFKTQDARITKLQRGQRALAQELGLDPDEFEKDITTKTGLDEDADDGIDELLAAVQGDEAA